MRMSSSVFRTWKTEKRGARAHPRKPRTKARVVVHNGNGRPPFWEHRIVLSYGTRTLAPTLVRFRPPHCLPQTPPIHITAIRTTILNLMITESRTIVEYRGTAPHDIYSVRIVCCGVYRTKCNPDPLLFLPKRPQTHKIKKKERLLHSFIFDLIRNQGKPRMMCRIPLQPRSIPTILFIIEDRCRKTMKTCTYIYQIP